MSNIDKVEIPLELKAMDSLEAIGGFHQNWVSGTTEIDGQEVEFRLTAGAGCGNPMLGFIVKLDEETHSFGVNIGDVVNSLMNEFSSNLNTGS